MNKRLMSIKYYIALILIMSGLLLTGCKKDEQAHGDNEDVVVFSYGGEDVTVGEVYIYYETIKQYYESMYGDDVWDTSIATTTDVDASVAKLVREAVVDEVVRTKTLARQAPDYNISLSDAEKKQVADEAKEIYKGLTDKDIQRMSITEAIIAKTVEQKLLAGYVEAALLEENPIEISDEEARMTTFYDLYFNCYEKDTSGAIVPLSDEMKQQQYENAVEACGLLTTAAVDNAEEKEIKIEDIAKLYKLDESARCTYSPEEINDIYGEDICSLLYSMENGTHSTVIETEYGYHIFKMIALTDKNATANKKNQMTKTAKDNRLNEKLTDWKEKIDKDFSYPESVNMEVYEQIAED